MFEIEDFKGPVSRIKVFGVGGCGCNVINSIMTKNLSGAEFIAVNTGTKSLNRSLAHLKIQIGKELTKGDGAGGDPEKGRLAALEDKDTLMSCLEDTDVVFVIAGMGKGTGTGAAPVIASLAKDKGLLTIAAVIKPFYFEGRQRSQKAEEGLKELTKFVDAFIVIPNDKICPNVQKGTPLLKSFEIANDALRKVIAGILDVILTPGLINSDIADLRTIVKMGGRAIDALHAFKADAVDLNMGCPARAVGKFGAGGMLMERPDEARRIVVEARKRTALPLSAKIRLGSDADSGKLKTFCFMLEGEGIDMLTVHARFKHEPFARNPRWAYIAEIKECIKIPVIANGGVFSVEDAERCLRVSGADGLMLGRVVVIRPWLFAEIAGSVFGGDITECVVSLPDVYAAFLEALNADYRPIYRLGRLKEFTHYFARDYKFGHSLASRVQSSSSMDEARERAWTFFANNSEESMAVIGTRVADNESSG